MSRPRIGPDGKLIKAKQSAYARNAEDIARQPIVGADGELLIADPDIDRDAYQDYVDEHFAHQIRSDRRAIWLQWSQWVIVFVVTFVLTVAVLSPVLTPDTPQQPTSVQQPATKRFIYPPLVLPSASQSTRLQLDLGDAPVQLDWALDGQRIITRSYNKDLYEWELSGETRLLKRDVDFFAQSPNGLSILVAMADGDLQLYDVQQGRFTILSTLLSDWDRPDHAVWSPDNRLVAIARGDLVRVVDVASSMVTHSIELDTPLASLQWTADGQGLMAPSLGLLWQWYIARPTATVLGPWANNLYITQIAPVFKIDGLAADGWVVVKNVLSSKSLAWVTADFQTVLTSFPYSNTSSLTLSRSPRGRLIAVKDLHRIVIYNIQSQGEEAVFNMPTGSAAATTIEWSPDGRYIAIGATDGIILWSPGVAPE